MLNSVVSIIEKSIKKYGKKIAYIDNENSVSFDDLEVMTSKIASRIIQMGCFNCPILVLSKRNVYTPVAYLGIVKSGNYYVPIDSTLNENRINQIIGATKSAILLTNRELLGDIEKLNFVGNVLVIEDLIEARLEPLLINDMNKKMNPMMPLYTIFTSGSTGRPKGVITSHLALINYIDAVNEVLNLSEEDILGNQSPLDYIAAIRDIYLPLFTGATTVIIPKNEFAMASELAARIDKQGITVLCWSAAGLEMTYKSGLLEEIRSNNIKKVLFSGSILPGRVLEAWQTRFPTASFINQYGPTEATASCTYYVVKEKASANTVLPIGIPYSNYNILLINEDGTKTEDGSIGEICVSGLGVTLGYFGDKVLSDEYFIQNPLNDKYREIIYKTGDLGRYDEAGMLFFCGRKDRQVKHFGHRIELEEIELYGKKIEGVQECVAVYDNDKSILHFVYSGEVEKKDIILFFRNNVPSFMVPRSVEKIEEIPHLPNGKIDIKAVQKLVI
ncbi:AMP-binding protein [Pseudobutyrivibrio sp. MD2005]|uniref:AMP-binding protein n=1 Tax=Pseudobutyrivibrio sp. MD2005 TaxID=1410616 RepID=UPI000481278A|nr:AMP-binding protein [Pseudobutyrivibrio sp. MD2005]